MIETEVDQSEPPAADGRTARRERGQILVIDSVIDLVLEGHAPPTAEMVAKHANVSMSSIFRYFDTFDDLRNQAARRFLDRYADLYEIPNLGSGSFAQRLDGFVSSRLDLHEATQPMATLVRQRAPEVASTHQFLDRLRAKLATQVRQHFNEELAATTPATQDDLVAVIATMTSFEAWDQLHNHHERTRAQIRRAWKHSLSAVLLDVRDAAK